MPQAQTQNRQRLNPETNVYLRSVSRGERDLEDVAGCEVYKMKNCPNGKILVPENSQESWVGGTGRNGEYIPPHNRDAAGNILAAVPNYDIKITKVEELRRVLELEQISDKVFVRPGFSGRYILQTENDGTLSMFYEGGHHRKSGKHCSRQTFHHGQWDKNRKFSNREINAQQQERVVEKKRQAEAIMPKVTNAGVEMPGFAPGVVVDTPKKPFIDLKPPSSVDLGMYHVNDSYTREQQMLAEVSKTAGRMLTDDERAKLQELFSGEDLQAGSRKARELFDKALEMINDNAAKESYITPASDKLREKLGLPGGTKVLLALSGNLGFRQELLHDPIDKAFGDMIRIRGRRGPLATKDDVVLVTVNKDPKTSRYFLKMSVVNGSSEDRKNWSVEQHNASFRYQPEAYVRWSIDRDADTQTVSFPKWLEANQQWLKEGTQNAKYLEGAFANKEKVLGEFREQARLEREAEQKRKIEAEKQSDVFAEVNSRDHRMLYRGTTVVESIRTNAAFSAAETRTGTFSVPPDANINYTLTREGSEPREVEIDSAAQIKKMSAADKALFEYAIVTPYSGKSTDYGDSAERSIKKVLNLFSADVYRPGSVASVFYSPQWYKLNLQKQLIPLYRRQNTPEKQRAFLTKLYGELSHRSRITEASIPGIVKKMRQ